MSIDVFPSERTSPQQALTIAQNDIEDIEEVLVVFVKKDDPDERVFVVHSTMPNKEINFYGDAIKQYALS